MGTFKYFETGFATKREVNEALNALNSSKIIDGEVDTYADLPAPANYNGEIWIVKTTTGVIFVNKKVAGLYVSNGTTWTIITPVDIDGYQKLITTATNDNIATTDANGQTKDGGKKIADLEQVINKTVAFSATPADIKFPTEKLVKDNLNLKEDIINKASSFSGTPANIKYPTEKLVKDNLDLKVDKVAGKVLSTNDYTTAEQTKLAGIATGATANSTDAVLLARSNHTGSQAISTITSLQTSLDGKEVSTNKDATSGYAGLTLFKINFKNVLNTFTSFFTNSNTVSRTYTFQDRDGTILDNTDLTAINTSIATKLSLTGGTLTGALNTLALTATGKITANASLDIGGTSQSINLNSGISNTIIFNSNGGTYPAFTTRSTGTKIVLYSEISANTTDYAFGIAPSVLWFSIPKGNSSFEWYSGITKIASLNGYGDLTILERLTQKRYSLLASNNGAQSIPHNVATAVSFGSDITNNNFGSRSADFTKFTPPAGTWIISYSLNYTGASATGLRESFLRFNGDDAKRYAPNLSAGLTNGPRFNGTFTLTFSGSDFIQLIVYQDSGSALNVGYAYSNNLPTHVSNQISFERLY